MARRKRRPRRTRPPLRRRPNWRRPIRTLTRGARRAVRRRLRRTAHRTRVRLAAVRARRRARQLEIQRAATDLTARSLTGKPRPAKTAPAKPAPATAGAAPMTQRVKRSRDGKFNGSTGAAKKTTGKKSAAKTTAKKTATPEARKAAPAQLRAPTRPRRGDHEGAHRIRAGRTPDVRRADFWFAEQPQPVQPQTVPQPQATGSAAEQRALAAGNKRVARIDKRTDATDARLNREFGH